MPSILHDSVSTGRSRSASGSRPRGTKVFVSEFVQLQHTDHILWLTCAPIPSWYISRTPVTSTWSICALYEPRSPSAYTIQRVDMAHIVYVLTQLVVDAKPSRYLHPSTQQLRPYAFSVRGNGVGARRVQLQLVRSRTPVSAGSGRGRRRGGRTLGGTE